jgi:hypothetical protein
LVTQLAAEEATIVDPTHPLFGQTLPILRASRHHLKERIVVALPDGRERRIPVSITNLVEHPPADTKSAGLITVRTLMPLVELIALWLLHRRTISMEQPHIQQWQESRLIVTTYPGPAHRFLCGNRRAGKQRESWHGYRMWCREVSLASGVGLSSGQLPKGYNKSAGILVVIEVLRWKIIVPTEGNRRASDYSRPAYRKDTNFADGPHVALAEQTGIKRIFSLDKDFHVCRINGKEPFEVIPLDSL